MYLLAVGRLALRRWITCVVGLLATLVLCLLISAHVPPDHRATSQMLLMLPPDASGTDTPTNPYLNLPQGLVTTASLIAGNLSTKDSQREVAAAGDTADYTISLVPESGPLLSITTTSSDPAQALATRDELMTLVDRQLSQLQENAAVPQHQLMTATRTTVSKEAETMSGFRYKVLVLGALLGLLYTLGACALLDRLFQWVRARRSRAVSSLPDRDADGPPSRDAALQDPPAEEPSQEPVKTPVEEPVEERVGGPRPTRPRARPRPRSVVVAALEHTDAEPGDRSLAG